MHLVKLILSNNHVVEIATASSRPRGNAACSIPPVWHRRWAAQARQLSVKHPWPQEPQGRALDAVCTSRVEDWSRLLSSYRWYTRLVTGSFLDVKDVCFPAGVQFLIEDAALGDKVSALWARPATCQFLGPPNHGSAGRQGRDTRLGWGNPPCKFLLVIDLVRLQ